MSEFYSSLNHTGYHFGLPVISDREKAMLDHQLDRIPDFLGHLAVYAIQIDPEEQLSKLIESAINNRDGFMPLGKDKYEMDIIGEGISDGFIAVTGLFELINMRRYGDRRVNVERPIFPLESRAMEYAYMVSRNTLEWSDFFNESQQNRDTIVNSYTESSPHFLDFISSLSEKIYSGNDNVDKPKSYEQSYRLGFDSGAESMLAIHYAAYVHRS